MLFELGAAGCVLFAGVCGFTLWRAKSIERRLLSELDHAQRLLRDTEQILIRRGRLADELAHEVKNPLSAIVCSAEALELMAGHLLPTDQRRCLGLIREFSSHVLRLVGDFLDLSRVDGGRIEPKISPVDVKQVLDSLYGLVEPSAQRRGIRLQLEYSEDALIAKVDPLHLKQVLFNLLQNALRYAGSGGNVKLRCAVHEESYIAVQVSDTGVGIKPENLERIFEPYVSNQPHHSEERGIGIGLSVCKALMELNGGVIFAESVPGTGSSFSVILPKGQELTVKTGASAQSGVPVPSTRTAAAQGRRVAVFSDSDSASVATCALLEAWGACVERVNDAKELVTKLGQASFDTVLLSAESMHEVSDEVCAQVHAQGGRILATAPDPESERFARERGADAVLSSPVTGASLLAALN